MKKKFEPIPPENRGKLHEALHVPEGEKIPKAKLEKAAHSENPHMRKMANFAKSASHWSKH